MIWYQKHLSHNWTGCSARQMQNPTWRSNNILSHLSALFQSSNFSLVSQHSIRLHYSPEEYALEALQFFFFCSVSFANIYFQANKWFGSDCSLPTFFNFPSCPQVKSVYARMYCVYNNENLLTHCTV